MPQSNLDDKLKEILFSNSESIEYRLKDYLISLDEKGVETTITQIKQLFKEEGKFSPDRTYEKAKSAVEAAQRDPGMLSGQEWYDRFWNEFVTGGSWTKITFTKSKVISLAEGAAKKAAGL